jgi:tetratricopeptide (TPR) repeat protein
MPPASHVSNAIPAFLHCLREANTYKVHLQVLSDAIEDYPNNGDFYYKRAYLYFGNEQWTQALDDMNQALDLDPNNGKYYLLRARLHQHLQQPEQAYADIQKAEKLQVQSTDFYTLLGELMYCVKSMIRPEKH